MQGLQCQVFTAGSSPGKLLLVASSLASCRVCFIGHLFLESSEVLVLVPPGAPRVFPVVLIMQVAAVLMSPSLKHPQGLGLCLLAALFTD